MRSRKKDIDPEIKLSRNITGKSWDIVKNDILNFEHPQQDSQIFKIVRQNWYLHQANMLKDYSIIQTILKCKPVQIPIENVSIYIKFLNKYIEFTGPTDKSINSFLKKIIKLNSLITTQQLEDLVKFISPEKVINMAINDMDINSAIKVINNLSIVTTINLEKISDNKFDIMLKNITTISYQFLIHILCREMPLAQMKNMCENIYIDNFDCELFLINLERMNETTFNYFCKFNEDIFRKNIDVVIKIMEDIEILETNKKYVNMLMTILYSNQYWFCNIAKPIEEDGIITIDNDEDTNSEYTDYSEQDSENEYDYYSKDKNTSVEKYETFKKSFGVIVRKIPDSSFSFELIKYFKLWNFISVQKKNEYKSKMIENIEDIYDMLNYEEIVELLIPIYEKSENLEKIITIAGNIIKKRSCEQIIDMIKTHDKKTVLTKIITMIESDKIETNLIDEFIKQNIISLDELKEKAIGGWMKIFLNFGVNMTFDSNDLGRLVGLLKYKTSTILCNICCVGSINSVYLECGHTMCSQCSAKSGGTCPYCKKHSVVKKIFLSGIDQ